MHPALFMRPIFLNFISGVFSKKLIYINFFVPLPSGLEPFKAYSDCHQPLQKSDCVITSTPLPLLCHITVHGCRSQHYSQRGLKSMLPILSLHNGKVYVN